MGYIKTDWIDEETPLSAENMNHIEDGIATLSNIIQEFPTIPKSTNIFKGDGRGGVTVATEGVDYPSFQNLATGLNRLENRVNAELSRKEDTSNKIGDLRESILDDEHYPTVKCLVDYVKDRSIGSLTEAYAIKLLVDSGMKDAPSVTDSLI